MCLARDHRATACRDPIRCFRCRRSGHTERNCKAPRPYASVHHRPAARKPLQPHQQPHQPSPPQPTPHSPNPLPPQSLPLPPPPPLPPTKTKTTGATPMAIGEPHTCPEVETVFVSNSFQLEHDARDWESCTLVPWALHLPLHAGAQDITDLITRELHLQPGEVEALHCLLRARRAHGGGAPPGTLHWRRHRYMPLHLVQPHSCPRLPHLLQSAPLP